MLLFLSAQDIKEITIGLIEGDSLVQLETKKGGPEEYLELIMKQLKSWHQSIKNVEAVVVVLGPGSATALRASVTIANAIGFARGIAVIGLANPDRLEPEQLLSISARQITAARTKSFLPTAPVYDRPAV
ncbi:hypothetical protein KJ910_03810 [Patescibacteria group bacterium]|nr:hypothetical protein [Patescibacteria group bacterium]MBU1906974.1 hypothetical protein [Patescibacteria group bacterium]